MVKFCGKRSGNYDKDNFIAEKILSDQGQTKDTLDKSNNEHLVNFEFVAKFSNFIILNLLIENVFKRYFSCCEIFKMIFLPYIFFIIIKYDMCIFYNNLI